VLLEINRYLWDAETFTETQSSNKTDSTVVPKNLCIIAPGMQDSINGHSSIGATIC
jgi:hypothetical protein